MKRVHSKNHNNKLELFPVILNLIHRSIISIPSYLGHVYLVAGELSNLQPRCVTHHQKVLVGPAPDEDLGLVGGGACLLPGLIVDGVPELSTVRCDLHTDRVREA